MKEKDLILKIEFGSKLYGTNTPNSDTDYRSVFIPSVNDILLQKAKNLHTSTNTKNNKDEKNKSTDIDSEEICLQLFLDDLVKGQSYALDMLFAPESSWVDTGSKLWIWRGIIENKDLLIHKNITSFVGYATKQAAKYGLKGSRLSAFREVVDFLKPFDQNKKLIDIKDILDKLVYPGDLYSGDGTDLLIKYTTIRGETHLDVCTRKIPLTAKISVATKLYEGFFNKYGTRAKMAEKNDGVDWKALSHAVRVLTEAIELLNTGNITFPRPDAELILNIKKGALSYLEVEYIIETGIQELKEAYKVSELRIKPDTEFAEELICSVYGEQVRAFFNNNEKYY